jgi:hypothetical protein
MCTNIVQLNNNGVRQLMEITYLSSGGGAAVTLGSLGELDTLLGHGGGGLLGRELLLALREHVQVEAGEHCGR